MKFHYFILVVFVLAGCSTLPKPGLEVSPFSPDAESTTVSAEAIYIPDTIPEAPKEYQLKFSQKDTLRTGIGVKAVVVSHDQKKVYSINLEDLSVFEFDREKKAVTRKLCLVAHKGWGFNYTTKKKIPSLQEKPVEAHLTHNDRFLWISLHNADGVVVWDLINGSTAIEGQPQKSAYLYSELTSDKSSPSKKELINLLWIKTGKTPKVITSTKNGQWLYIANWHSNSVSAIDISQPSPETWIIKKTIAPFAIPRGMVVTPDDHYLMVAQMGSQYISKVEIPSHRIISHFTIGLNPRHLVIADPYLYVSLNKGAKLLKVDLEKEAIVKEASTDKSPRTIALSKDNHYVFVVCYHANQLQVFKTDDLSLVDTFKSNLHPVAVAIAEDDQTVEAWVGNYSSGTIDVFTFNKEIIEPAEARQE